MNNYLEQWQSGVSLELEQGEQVGLLNGELGFVRDILNNAYIVDTGCDLNLVVSKDGRLLDDTSLNGDNRTFFLTENPIIYPLKNWQMKSAAVIERKIEKGALVWAWDSHKSMGCVAVYVRPCDEDDAFFVTANPNSNEDDFRARIIEPYDHSKHRASDE